MNDALQPVDAAEAAKVHFGFQDRLPMWVVYRPTTSDHTGQWCCRMHLTLPDCASTKTFLLGESLAAIRAQLPLGLICLGRQEGDDPVIEEVWL